MPVRPDRGGHLAAPLAIAVCGVAVLALVVAGLAMARRGRSTASDSLSVTEIDRSTPRVGHPGVPGTRPLPVNGYENPTYQYYQATEAAATEAGKDAAAADQWNDDEMKRKRDVTWCNVEHTTAWILLYVSVYLSLSVTLCHASFFVWRKKDET